MRALSSSCPGLSRASTSYGSGGKKTWMAGTSPAMTKNEEESENARRFGQALGTFFGRQYLAGTYSSGGMGPRW
jgi:hypothetical protein